jgi:hypothetical protein
MQHMSGLLFVALYKQHASNLAACFECSNIRRLSMHHLHICCYWCLPLNSSSVAFPASSQHSSVLHLCSTLSSFCSCLVRFECSAPLRSRTACSPVHSLPAAAAAVCTRYSAMGTSVGCCSAGSATANACRDCSTTGSSSRASCSSHRDSHV